MVVIIINKERIVRSFLELFFKNFFPGAMTKSFCAGYEAWPIIVENSDNRIKTLVVTGIDYGDRSMDGLDLARLVRSNAACNDIPIIMTSGLGDRNAKEAREAGVNLFTEVPFDCVTFQKQLQMLFFQ